MSTNSQHPMSQLRFRANEGEGRPRPNSCNLPREVFSLEKEKDFLYLNRL
jgi:hypothetical protein